MKSIRNILAIVCALLLMFSLTIVLATEASVPIPARFSKDDLTVADLSVYASKDEALVSIGTPSKREKYVVEATGEQREVLIYENGLVLTFADSVLISVDVTEPGISGPRGVEVGQTKTDVMNRFFQDENIAPEEYNSPNLVRLIYTGGYVAALKAQLPPSGYIKYNDDGTFSINYAAPAVPFSEDVLKNPEDFIYEEIASFQAICDENEVVTTYSWYLSPWAE